MDMDVGKELRRAVDSGKVLFGMRETKKSILKGSAQMVIISANARANEKETVERLCEVAGIPFFLFNAPALQVGGICGKPFVVSFMAVEKPGKSRVLEAVQRGKKK
jgi:large subunit ribosomal protein L30e